MAAPIPPIEAACCPALVAASPAAIWAAILDYPRYPHMTRSAEALQGPTNFHYYYGTRTLGYLLAPRDGNYRFYLSGDDSAQFSLSSDAQPGNAQQIAEVLEPTARGDFFVDPDRQISEPVALVKGQRYYFELLHKEHSSSDHHAVYWGADGDDSVELGGVAEECVFGSGYRG